MYLGLVLSSAVTEVDALVITHNRVEIFNLDTLVVEPEGEAPIPSNIEASLNGDVVHITWTGGDLKEEGTSYQIVVSKDGGGDEQIKSYTYKDFVDKKPLEVSYDLTATGSYKFGVTGKSGSKESKSVTSNPIEYTLPLEKPEFQSITQDGGTVFLKWKPVKEATSYDVTVIEEGETKYIEEVEGTSLDIMDLEDGKRYTFTVTAKRDKGGNESELSEPSEPSEPSESLTYQASVIPTTPEWTWRVFGDNTGSGENTKSGDIDADSITLNSTGGKISSNKDGINFYYTPWDSTKGFQLTAKVHVDSIATKKLDNQIAFGLMLRDKVGIDRDTTAHQSSFVAAGGAYERMRGFYRKTSTTAYNRENEFTSVWPKEGDEHTLRIIKVEGKDSEAIVSVDGKNLAIDTKDMFTSDMFYIGLFAARDAKVTYSDIEFLTNVTEVNVTSPPTKTEYLVGQDLDLTGLAVEATVDGTPTVLSKKDYAVTGYDKDKVGTQTVKVNYGGKFGTFEVNVEGLTCEEINVQYAPAKTTYYLNDELDLSGMVIQGRFDSGLVRALDSEEYTLSGFDGTRSGEQTITITLNDDEKITTNFKVIVKAAALEKLEITKNPVKMIYYLGDKLDLNGLSVSAVYDDGTKVRLERSEYEYTDIDTTTAGEKSVRITHKDKTVDLPLTVKEKELVGIEITKYPTTTYVVGDVFDTKELEVSKVYDNGDKDLLASDLYTIKSDAFDSAKPGAYKIEIVPSGAGIESIVYTVTVREKVEYPWDFIAFGQSISKGKNYYETKDDGTVRIVAEEGAGKVTGDHDGISFYYTEIDAQNDNFVLSADIKVNKYAKTPHDGQESFGIMARDAIGTDGDSGVFASNIAAVGGFSGGTGDANGTQLFVRTGVESSDGAGSKGITKVMLNKDRPSSTNTPYKLTLAKTNSGYTAKINDGKEELIYEPDILKVQDSGKIYVGFYTGRLADIEVSNIDLKVTEAASDAPKIDPPAVAVTPKLEIMSLDKVSKTNYNLIAKTNVDGIISVKQGNTFIAENEQVIGGKALEIPTTVTASGDTAFSIVFVPDDTQYLTSYDKMIQNFTVTMKTFVEDGDLYVSPKGTNTGKGTEESPLDLDTAITFVKEGQKIIMLDGTYLRNSSLQIKKYNDGTAQNMKYLVAAPGAKPVIDFDKKSEGGVLGADYWHIKGIDFVRSEGNKKGFTIGGNHNIIELCGFYENGDTGLQISRTDGTQNHISQWPSYNLVLNCTSAYNMDPAHNNADGFAAKLTSGVGNVFRGCIAHHNIDDAWDLYTKVGSGAIGAITIEGSIAYKNGYLKDGTPGSGDKNGFKLGGEGVHVPHLITNSLAYDNGTTGFTSNSNPGVIAKNNISFNNGTNLAFSTYGDIVPDFKVDGFISYGSGRKDTLQNGYKDSTYLSDGSKSVNKSGNEFTAADFEKLGLNTPYERDENGDIIWNGLWDRFLKPEDSGSGGGGGGGGSSSEPKPVTSTDGKGQVHPVAGGTIGVSDKATVKIPKGALKGTKALQITVEKVSKAAAIDAAKNLISEVYEFKVGDYTSYQFDKEVEITLSIDKSKLAKGMIPAIHYYDEDAAKWINIGGKVSGDTITVKVDHFTKFAVLGIEEAVEETVKETIELKDIKGHWAEDSILKLIEMGSVGGYPDGTFRPQDNITRAEFTKILVESLNLTMEKGKAFTDTSNHWAKEYIEAASFHGIIGGYDDDRFGPNDYLTREQMATIMVNAVGAELTSTNNSFVDNKDISNWAKAAVNTAVKEGIMLGLPDNSFKPKALASRAEAVVVIARVLK